MRPSCITVSLFILAAFTFLAGCSGNEGISSATLNSATLDSSVEAAAMSAHGLWGLWQFTADPSAETLDITAMRTGDLHVNVLPFLEPPPFVNLTLETLQFNGDIIEADIGLRHPFLGLTEFTGFDVCGILISNGSISGYDNPDLILAGGDDTYLMNPDGLTRWWNPSEFPHDGTIFGYTDGLLGTPDSSADFNSTLNGYKFFCDELDDPDDDVGTVPASSRAMFSPGNKNVRHYTIHMSPGGLVFNYAVDASWQYPEGQPPYQAPEDFAPGANRIEAWNVEVTELSNTLFNDGALSGGGLSLSIDVWDHFDGALNSVKLESPGNFVPAASSTPAGGGAGFSTYQVDVTDATPSEGSIDILIEVACEETGYGGLIPGEDVTAYFIYTADVSSTGFIVTSPNGGEEWAGFSHEDITWISPGSVDYVDIHYSKDDFVSDINEIATDVANTGTYDWYVPNNPSTTVKVRVSESGGGLQDISDNYFTILEGACNFGGTGFTLAQTYMNIPNTYTQAGVYVSKQDPVTRLFARNYYNPGVGNNGGTIFVFNASNPLGGIVAQFDTGVVFYTNNPEAMWIDSLSEPGVDRIIYHLNNAYTSEPVFRTIDWNGSAFVNPQILPYGTAKWRLCVKPNGDLVVMHLSYNIMYFYLYDKSNSYSHSSLFSIDPASVTGMTSGASVQKMAYDPEIDALLLLYKQQSTSESGKLYAIDANSGALLFSDLNVFGSGHDVSISMGLNVDMDSPGCRVLAYGGTSDYSGYAWMARYSGDLSEKKTYEYTGFTDGLCKGDLETDGTLWASCENNYSRFYKFSIPPDW